MAKLHKIILAAIICRVTLEISSAPDYNNPPVQVIFKCFFLKQYQPYGGFRLNSELTSLCYDCKCI